MLGLCQDSNSSFAKEIQYFFFLRTPNVNFFSDDSMPDIGKHIRY